MILKWLMITFLLILTLYFRLKPVDIKLIVSPFRDDFEELFCNTFSRQQNIKFLHHVQECYVKQKWSSLLKLIEHTVKSGIKKFSPGNKKHKLWKDIKKRTEKLKIQIREATSALAFAFIEVCCTLVFSY